MNWTDHGALYYLFSRFIYFAKQTLNASILPYCLQLCLHKIQDIMYLVTYESYACIYRIYVYAYHNMILSYIKRFKSIEIILTYRLWAIVDFAQRTDFLYYFNPKYFLLFVNIFFRVYVLV